jgi:hypothetical protein
MRPEEKTLNFYEVKQKKGAPSDCALQQGYHTPHLNTVQNDTPKYIGVLLYTCAVQMCRL